MIPVNDFRLYWLASKALLSGHNPYAPSPGHEVFSMLHPGETLVPFNPPWALPLILPLGWMPYQVGEFVWLSDGFSYFPTSSGSPTDVTPVICKSLRIRRANRSLLCSCSSTQQQAGQSSAHREPYRLSSCA